MKLSDDNSDLQMLDSDDVMSLLKLSKTTLWRHIREGKVPQPVYIGRSPLWHKQTLHRWLDDLGAFSVRPTPPTRIDRGREIDGFC